MTFDFDNTAQLAKAVKEEVKKVIVGNDENIDLILAAILARGHVLIEGVPGVGKTLMVRAIAKSLDVDFTRIQFTPDMMPADIIGTKVFNVKTSEFSVRKGPVFTNLLLADEINRTPPKTQSALLQAMAEKKVNLDGEDFVLDDVFTVFATQNPVEYEGTYPLPEAQLDRFMIKLETGYPDKEQGINLLKMFNSNGYVENLESIMVAADKAAIADARKNCDKVIVEEPIIVYINEIIEATRKRSAVALGASPRAGIAILLLSKAFANLNGRDFVTPDDVKYLAPYVLCHRLLLNPEDEMEGIKTCSIVEAILSEVKVPR